MVSPSKYAESISNLPTSLLESEHDRLGAIVAKENNRFDENVRIALIKLELRSRQTAMKQLDSQVY